ncbi:MAG: cyclic nucleotide-binding domain-containing protein [Polyangiaceae bacterium]|nr:cyclic nucleotide-binding domain-containing protein [Polyangiaceae bacterium]MCW5790395.1 cyclic nucleotide-binding domain-containing protein [Polyangiaceae bacterium]
MLTKKVHRAKELERAYADGELVVREGDMSREMFVIQAGKVVISKRVGERELELAVLSKGDFFGEMSVLESLPRDANARALGETRLLVISAGGLLVRMRRDPTFAFEMLHRLSGRVRTLNHRLVELLESQGGPRAGVMLYSPDQGEAPPSVQLTRPARAGHSPPPVAGPQTDSVADELGVMDDDSGAPDDASEDAGPEPTDPAAAEGPPVRRS